jgi:hypothetical protein
MSVRTFDDFTRRAAGELSRRASLVMLGTPGLATLASPVVADAKNNKNKNKNKNRSEKKAAKECKKDLAECSAQDLQCSRQVEECTPLLTAVCGGDPECLGVIACCQFLEDCDVTAFLACVNTSGS